MVATPPTRARRALSGVPVQDSDTPDATPDVVPAPAEKPVAAPPPGAPAVAPAVAPVKPAPATSVPVIAPPPTPVTPPAPEPQAVTPPAEPPPTPREATYPVEIRLQNAATTGESVYHVSWTARMVRAYLDDTLTKIRIPVRTHFGHDSAPNILRYVQLGFVGEILIHNWPDAANAPE